MRNIKIPWAKPEIGEEEFLEVSDSFKSKWLTMGPKVKKIEQEFARLLNVPYAIAVSNGTVALDLSLKTLRIKPGDEIIVPAMTYFATISSVCYQNATPVFVDIDRTSFNLDPIKISSAISKKTKAIIFIDYGGNPSNYDDIFKVSEEYGIPLLHDAAQTLGAQYKGKPIGAQAQISTMSFHMAKVMTTVEGGMIFSHNEEVRNEILSRRNQGEPVGGKYKHIMLGTNARMTDIQAAIGLAQLKKLPRMLEVRNRVAQKYNSYFSQYKNVIKVASTVYEKSKNAYFFYPILIKNRDYIAKTLLENYGIDTRIAYPMPVYEQEIFTSGTLNYRKCECPVAEEVTSQILNLPIFPSMTNEMIDYVCESIVKEIIK